MPITCWISPTILFPTLLCCHIPIYDTAPHLLGKLCPIVLICSYTQEWSGRNPAGAILIPNGNVNKVCLLVSRLSCCSQNSGHYFFAIQLRQFLDNCLEAKVYITDSHNDHRIVMALAVLCLSILSLAGGGYHPFLYFQF